MKHTKLLIMAVAALFTGSAMAENLVEWGDMTQSTQPSAVVGTVETDLSYDKINIDKKTVYGYGLKAGSSLKNDKGTIQYYIKISADGGFLKGDTVFYSHAIISDKTTTIIVADKDLNTLYTGKQTNNVQKVDNPSVDTCILSQDADFLYLGREGSTNTYVLSIKVTRISKDDATLQSITINDEALEGFDAATLTYNVELPYGTTTVPTVVATPASNKAKAEVTAATSLPGTTTIVVTAEDDTTTKTYTINFTVAASLNTDATLKTLTVDGKAIALKEDVVEYSYEVPFYGKGLVAAEANDDNAKIAITQATEIPGDATVLVTAEDGETTLTYTLSLTRSAGFEWATVSKNTTWDWSKTGVNTMQYTDTTPITKSDTIVLANAMDGTWTTQIANNDDFNSQALRVVGEYMVRDGQYFQGPYVSFVAENAGTIKVTFSNTGNRAEAETRYLYVNGEKTEWGSYLSKEKVTTDTIPVPAGVVALTFMEQDETKGNLYGRIYSIEYTVSTATAIDNASAEIQAVKVIRNGQFLIQKGNQTYNAQGTVVE